MTKDDRLTKQQKEMFKEKCIKEKDQYEKANLGNYRRCYPSENEVSNI